MFRPTPSKEYAIDAAVTRAKQTQVPVEVRYDGHGTYYIHTAGQPLEQGHSLAAMAHPDGRLTSAKGNPYMRQLERLAKKEHLETYAMSAIPAEEWAKIPEHCRAGLARYLDLGIPVGDFLTAVLSNDLTRAVLFADDINLPVLRNYIHFLHFMAPPLSYGSKDNHDLWIAQGGLRGQQIIREAQARKGETP